MNARIHRLLNIKLSESGRVLDLFKVQLFIGIANAFINITAFTFFIHHFSVDGLPYLYLSIAGGLLLLNLVYEKLEHRMSPLHLLKWIIAVSAVILLILWLGLLAWDTGTIIFLLAVWSLLFYMVTGYAYWGLVSLLFNIRESKRVFSIVGSGDIPAKLIGYLCAPLLIPFIGINNLLLLSLAALGIGFFLVNNLIRKNRFRDIKWQHDHQTHHHSRGWSDFFRNNFFIKNKLIFAISVLAILSYNVFNFIDFTFISQIKLRYNDMSQLAFFVAVFFAIGRFVALILKLVFTSRLIERLGIISCLLITPFLLFVLSIAILAFSDYSYYGLYFFGIMAMITEVLRSTIQEPAFFILFQPLNEQSRLKGHIIAKGYMLPPSLIIVGLSLLIMKDAHITIHISFTVKILLLNLGLWALMVYFVRREYLTALHSSIAKGTFSASGLTIYDQKAIELLLEKLQNKNEAESIYALKLLENAHYGQLDQVLTEQLTHPAPRVRNFALERLLERGKLNSEDLKQLLDKETAPGIREKVIDALCKIDNLFLQQLSSHISEQPYSIRKIIIIHLLNQPEFEQLYIAGKELDHLIKSPLPEERELALNIISELKNIRFSLAIEQLVNDADPSVQRSAIMAACKLRSKGLLPFMFDLLETDHKYIVLKGLVQYGDALFEDVDSLGEQQLKKHKFNLIKITSKIKGPKSIGFLLDCLQYPDSVEKAVNALWTKGYQAESTEIRDQLRKTLELYLNNGIEKINLLPSVRNEFSEKLIKGSLQSEIKNDLTVALKICAILYSKKNINRVIELFENTNRDKIFNAMEMIELILPKHVSKQINILMDHILDPGVVKKGATLLPATDFYDMVIYNKSEKFNHWTKSVCLYACLSNEDFDFLQTLSSNDDTAESPIFSETKNYVLKISQSTTYVNH
ncbi:MAG: MFS transporter [Chitinophagaceae bacterium]